MPSFEQFFSEITGFKPLDYQRRLAGGDSGLPCESCFINIPTGLGKTAAVILAWLWNRVELKNEAWPRRLIYCLPMRALVEQTAENTRKWLEKLGSADSVGLQVLMGGEETEEWDLEPERPAILIGSQDMLLSRALNRGYGMSRYRWPMHFGLLNNDCLWVLDETQLMGPGLATARQLEAFRGESGMGRLGSFPAGGSATWYASATADETHLQTRHWRDFPRPANFSLGLLEAERKSAVGTVAERLTATKALRIERAWNFGDKQKGPSSERIDAILSTHREMVEALRNAASDLPRRTIVVCNTVDRAVAIHSALRSQLGEGGADLMLMHSRFRAKEREDQAARLGRILSHQGQIVVATQVIEAGVDISSGVLWTEVAPLACLVQRFGRLNRKGEFGFRRAVFHGFGPQAIVVGIDSPDPERKGIKKDEKEKALKEADGRHRPYTLEKCNNAWSALARLNGDASPAALDGIKGEVNASIDKCPYSLQQHELFDFFDTDANLSLGFTDVSPFVRGIDPETDLYLAWREWPDSDDGKEPDMAADFQRAELCAVSIGKAYEARGLLSNGWIWRGKDTGWTSVRNVDLVPGMTVLLPVTVGGYREDSGWTGQESDKPVPSAYEPSEMPSDEDMLTSLQNGWQSIARHTSEVTAEWEGIEKTLQWLLDLSLDQQSAILTATHWHDLGKNHSSWQSAVEDTLRKGGIPIPADEVPLAKFSLADSPLLRNADGTPKFRGKDLRRELRRLRQSFKPGISHEVASALAFRQFEQNRHGTERPIESLLAEYLIMSHHGRVRKVLRDEIPRSPKGDAKDIGSVRGVANGDVLQPVTIAGQELECASLSTDCRRMGRDEAGNESYTRGVLRLLEHYGPFRLAFFEALFRAADIRASKRAGRDGEGMQP